MTKEAQARGNNRSVLQQRNLGVWGAASSTGSAFLDTGVAWGPELRFSISLW